MNFAIESFDAITGDRIAAAVQWVHSHFPASPLEKVGAVENVGEVWAKFECDNPTGAFKIRGGLVYFRWLKSIHPHVQTVIAATKGNHGQSVALAARTIGLQCRVVVPYNNSPTKNRAMRELGAELVKHGRDFAEAFEFAQSESQRTGAHFVPSFDWKLVLGVSTYGHELFSSRPDIDAVFVPIGLGSGICGTIAARRALNAKADIIGVVAEQAPVYAESFAAKRIVEKQEFPDTVADGVACRMVNPDSFSVIRQHAKSIVTVPEANIEKSIVELHQSTGRRIEGAGAIAHAACQLYGGQYDQPAVIISGGNIDDETLERLNRNSV